MWSTSSSGLLVAAITSLMIFNSPSLAFRVSRAMKFRSLGGKFDSLMPLRGRSDDIGSGKKEKYSKSNLPTKICCVCHRPYSWRKKWEKVWEEVKYCSERCRRNRSSGTTNTQPSEQGTPTVKSIQEWNKKSAINIAQTLAFLGAIELSRLTPAMAQSSPIELLDVFEGIDWNDEIDLSRKSNFRRLDETPDSLFYSKPRFTEHIDAPAVAALVAFQQQQLIQLARRLKGPAGRPRDLDLLDLCASHVSHLPTTDFPPRSRPPILLPSNNNNNNKNNDNTVTDCSQQIIDFKTSRVGSDDEAAGTGRIVVGLGMNAEELQRNPQLTHCITHDLNTCTSLPFGDARFDAVLLQLSVDYLIRPLEVIWEVGRVLRVGGVVVISFSNRVFIDKAVAAWTGKDDREHITTVGAYIHFTGGFEDPPRAFDLSPGRGSDPLFAVVGFKKPL